MAGNDNLPLIYRGVCEICTAAGINKKKLSHYVESEGLPASKLDGKEWLAVAVDVQEWVVNRLRARTKEKALK